VSFDHTSLLGRLTALADLAGQPERLVIGFSGGLDSTVMLHALSSVQKEFGAALLAVYVDHGLHDDSAQWGEHCKTVARQLDVEYQNLVIHVDTDSGQGVEGSARIARYDAFRKVIREGDWLLSAHHKDDQAETLLLNLLRGSGPAGLAGIGEVQPFSEGWLVRPLLAFARSELQAYAETHGLGWIDDPSNEDRQFDRNYLRHEVLPILERRWPDASSRLRQSALLAGEAASMLDQLADNDLRSLGNRPDRLSLTGLRALSSARQRNLLRYVVRELGLPAPPSRQLISIVTDLVPARDDAQPVVQWGGAEIRRYRDNVYVLPGMTDSIETAHVKMTSEPLVLGQRMGELRLEAGAKVGLADAVIAAGLEVGYRQGGEEIKLPGQSHTRKLKKLLQEEGIVPWLRERLPLLYSGGNLVAVADLWIAASAISEPGTAVRWKKRPPIH
jgi:tRNA(Ile)-lysidine synthase